MEEKSFLQGGQFLPAINGQGILARFFGENNDPFTENILYLLNEVKERTELVNSLKAMSEQQKEINADNDYQEKYVSRNISHKLRMQSLEKYQSIQVQVMAWEPPTKEHQKLKEFMLQQLRCTIDSDCISTIGTIVNEARPSTFEWYKNRLEFAEKSLLSAKTDLEEALKRKENSFNFAIELAKSIGLPKQVDRQPATPKPNQETRSNEKAEYLKAKQQHLTQQAKVVETHKLINLSLGIILVTVGIVAIGLRTILPFTVIDKLFFAACILVISLLIYNVNKNRN